MNATALLRNEYLKRKDRNEAYSIRAFSRDIGVSHALVSQIFSGKRVLTPKQAHKISLLLDLSEQESKRWIDAALAKNSATVEETSARYSDVKFDLDQLTSRWFYTAMLELTDLKTFKPDPIWIAKKLGITSVEATDALERLLKLGLLVKSKGRLQKSQNLIRFHAKASSATLRAYYGSILEKAKREMTDTSPAAFQSRYIGGGTLSIRSDRIAAARKRLKELQDQFIDEFASDEADHVYQVSLNFFSLTKGMKP